VSKRAAGVNKTDPKLWAAQLGAGQLQTSQTAIDDEMADSHPVPQPEARPGIRRVRRERVAVHGGRHSEHLRSSGRGGEGEGQARTWLACGESICTMGQGRARDQTPRSRPRTPPSRPCALACATDAAASHDTALALVAFAARIPPRRDARLQPRTSISDPDPFAGIPTAALGGSINSLYHPVTPN
jgi:hypothetical protein